MSEFIFIWFLGALSCGSLLSIWFDSDLPCIVTKILRGLGWGKHESWPDDIQYKYWMRFQWKSWIEDKIPGWLYHMLNCPRCFSCHLAYIVGIPISILSGHFWWVILIVPSYPAAGQIIYGFTKSALSGNTNKNENKNT